DLGGRCDEHTLHHEPFDCHAEDLGGVRGGLGRVAGQLDATGLAAAPGVHLRLDDHRPAQPGGDGAGLVGARGDFARGDRYAVPYPWYTASTLVRISRTSASISRPRIAATRSLSATASIPSSRSAGSSYTGGPPPPQATTMCPAATR